MFQKDQVYATHLHLCFCNSNLLRNKRELLNLISQSSFCDNKVGEMEKKMYFCAVSLNQNNTLAVSVISMQ